MADQTPPPEGQQPPSGGFPPPPPPPQSGGFPPPQGPGAPPPPPPGGTPPPPPPPPGGYGPPPGAYATPPGYAPAAGLQNGPGTAALVFGLLSLFCCPVIFSILAIVYGRKGMALADQGLANNRTVAQVGYVIGIVTLVIGLIGIVFTIIAAITGGVNWSFKVG